MFNGCVHSPYHCFAYFSGGLQILGPCAPKDVPHWCHKIPKAGIELLMTWDEDSRWWQRRKFEEKIQEIRQNYHLQHGDQQRLFPSHMPPRFQLD